MKPVELQADYDPVAEDYAREFCNEMSWKPFDRKMLDWLAEKVNELGTICDLGSEEMKACLTKAGFELEEVIERDPYPDIEVQTRRAYVFARTP